MKFKVDKLKVTPGRSVSGKFEERPLNSFKIGEKIVFLVECEVDNDGVNFPLSGGFTIVATITSPQFPNWSAECNRQVLGTGLFPFSEWTQYYPLELTGVNPGSFQFVCTITVP